MAALTDRVVYTARAAPPRKWRRPCAASVFKGGNGRWHTYLNAAIPLCDPPATLDDSLCKRCGYGYSHVMAEKRELCCECVLEDVAEAGMSLQSQGVEMGWRMPGDYHADVVRGRHGHDCRWKMKGMDRRLSQSSGSFM